MYLEIITRYMRMGAGQFLRDYRRDYRIQRSSALRKAVLQRNEKAKERKMKVSLKEIEVDKSVGKRCLHIRSTLLVILMVLNICHDGIKGSCQRPLLHKLHSANT